MFLPPRHTGAVALGSTRPAAGRVVDVALTPYGYGSADVTFAYDGLNADYDVVAFADGEPVDRVPASLGKASLANLSDGSHTVHLRPVRTGTPIPERHGDPLGQRAYITWPRCSSTRLAAYRVYYLVGATWTLLSQLDQWKVSRLDMQPGSACLGRLSVLGGLPNRTTDYPGEVVITIGTGGAYTLAQPGIASTTGTITPGASMTTVYGATLTWHDRLEDYADGSTYTFYVGPPVSYLSAELTPGTYSFAVAAVDTGGAESDKLTLRQIRTVNVPPDPDDPGLTYEGDSRITILPVCAANELENHGGDLFDSYAVMANYDPNTNTYLDHIDTTAPLGNQWWGYDEGGGYDMPNGTLRCYIWTRKDGIVNKSSAMYTRSFPPTPTDSGLVLSDPLELKAIPYGAGQVLLAWTYRWRPGDSCVTFKMFGGFSAATVFSNFNGLVSPATALIDGYPVSTYQYVVNPALYGWTTGPVYLSVRAGTAAGAVLSTNTTYASCTPSVAGMAFTGFTWGAAE